MKPILTTLKQVIFEIFGDMFFMFPDDYDPEENVPFPANWEKFRIKISSQEVVYLNFYFTPEIKSQMAENFLGESLGQLPESVVTDTIKEAVNVIGGNLLNRLSDDDSLGIPEESPVESTMVLKKLEEQKQTILLNIEEQPFLASMTQEK